MRVKIIDTLPLNQVQRQKLAVGTEHETITPTKAEQRITRGAQVWVMGAEGERVRLFPSEYEEVK